MPELPEVETIRRDLSREVLKKPIVRLVVKKPKMVRGESAAGLQRALVGSHFTKIARRGKLLVWSLTGGDYLLLHLKMTGQLIYREGERVVAGGHALPRPADNFAVPNRYSHLQFFFADGSALFFNDLRQFGFVQRVSEEGRAAALATYGVEPLSRSFTLKYWRDQLARRPRRSIKAALLDQRLLAGVGNIYADEVCYRAGVRPMRLVKTLSAAEIQKLHAALPELLRQAVRYRGTTFSDYRDGRGRRGRFTSKLAVYGRAGQPCRRRDGGFIVKIKNAGRGTHYCPVCQR